jgi:hypothetical protein
LLADGLAEGAKLFTGLGLTANDARFLLWAITANAHRIVNPETGEVNTVV